MRRVGKSIYDSKAWQKLKDMYMTSKNYVCERCGGVATICHHKKYITAANVNNPELTLPRVKTQGFLIQRAQPLSLATMF